MLGLYDYTIPPGYGDTWFQYAFNGDGLTNGVDYFQKGIPIFDGAFIVRYWAGQESICQGAINIYDRWTRGWFAPPGVNYFTFATGQTVLPEHYYPPDGNIRFDLRNALAATAGTSGEVTFYRSQLVFTGVKRRPNHTSDPAPSLYKYYEKPFFYTITVPINNYAATAGVLNPAVQYLQSIQDYDFELRRVECNYTSAQGAADATRFKITLYDNYWNALSNVPIMASRFMHFNNSASLGQQNFFPAPPILYKIGSVIRFDIWSLIFSPTALPQTFTLLFWGIRRIPCQ